MPQFDDYAAHYESELAKGLAVSGESSDFFARERIEYTARWLRALQTPEPRTFADFGCGVGNAVPHIRRSFPAARIIGLDVSPRSLEHACAMHGSDATFSLLDELPSDCDVVYCNGVFHHIPPAERATWVERIHHMLAPGGHFALWENNPWNPGTQLVMHRIPFDRDAVMLRPGETRAMLERGGFEIAGTRSRFYFPRMLAFLRPLERFGERVPLGAQYCVLARRPIVA